MKIAKWIVADCENVLVSKIIVVLRVYHYVEHLKVRLTVSNNCTISWWTSIESLRYCSY